MGTCTANATTTKVRAKRGPRLALIDTAFRPPEATPPAGGAAGAGVSGSGAGRMIVGAYRCTHADGPRTRSSALLPYIRGLARRGTDDGRRMMADPATVGRPPGVDAPAHEPKRRWRPTRLQWAIGI